MDATQNRESDASRTLDQHGALQLAEAVRGACLAAAREGYESAGMSGLCHEGAMEMSLDSIRRMDLGEIIDAVIGRSRD